jgi:hypothetical protein
VLEQLAPERLDRVRREASQQIASMTTDDGIPLRLEALIAVGHR